MIPAFTLLILEGNLKSQLKPNTRQTAQRKDVWDAVYGLKRDTEFAGMDW